MSRNRGQPKPKLRDLSRVPPTDEEQEALLAALSSKTAPPHVTAILGSVFVEHELEVSIRRRFPHVDDNTWSMMLSDNGPLSSFFAKIILGRGFKIYDDEMMDNLHIVRSIRNAFAHSKKLIGFDHELVEAELRKTHIQKGKYKKYLRDIQKVSENPKGSYVSLCFVLSLTLMRKRTASLRAKNRKLRRQTGHRSPYTAGLAAFLSPSLPKGAQGFGTLASLGHQTAGPTSATQVGILSGLFGPPPKTDDNEGK